MTFDQSVFQQYQNLRCSNKSPLNILKYHGCNIPRTSDLIELFETFVRTSMLHRLGGATSCIRRCDIIGALRQDPSSRLGRDLPLTSEFFTLIVAKIIVQTEKGLHLSASAVSAIDHFGTGSPGIHEWVRTQCETQAGEVLSFVNDKIVQLNLKDILLLAAFDETTDSQHDC